jgi:DNA-binding transcriptional LysR family regulator
MQIELIETYLDLMETTSFNRTAERLGVTQSTVSSRIATLEAALGRKLFARSRAGTRPTAAGQRFLAHARDLRHEWNEARRDVQTTGDAARRMRIGIQNDLAPHIGEWVAEFRQAFPATSFYMEVDYSSQMTADVLAGELDLAVLFTLREIADLHHEYVGEIRYRMISTHAKRLEDVRAERHIFGNYSPAFSKVVRNTHRELADAPIASGQNTVVCSLLASMGGSAFVLEESAVRLVGSELCHFVEDVDAIAQPIYVATHVRHRHAHPHKRILGIIRRHLEAQALQERNTASD